MKTNNLGETLKGIGAFENVRLMKVYYEQQISIIY